MFNKDVYLDGVALVMTSTVTAVHDRPCLAVYVAVREGEALYAAQVSPHRTFTVTAPKDRWEVREAFRQTPAGRKFFSGQEPWPS